MDLFNLIKDQKVFVIQPNLSHTCLREDTFSYQQVTGVQYIRYKQNQFSMTWTYFGLTS